MPLGLIAALRHRQLKDGFDSSGAGSPRPNTRKRPRSPDRAPARACAKKKASSGKQGKCGKATPQRLPHHQPTRLRQACTGVGHHQSLVLARPPRDRRRADNKQSVSALHTFIGDVGETREAHLARHSGGRRDCPRCRFYLFGSAWKRSYGHVQVTQAGCRGQVVWLQERPSKWGGTWALGCAVCASMLAQLESSPNPKLRGHHKRLGTKWGRYEVRQARALQASHIQQHTQYECHRIAVDMFCRPDVPLEVVMKETTPLGTGGGSVPLPQDWLRAFRVAHSPVSFAKATAMATTEHFIQAIRHRTVQRRAVLQQLRVMAEVVRQRKRQWMANAHSVTIAVDDKGEFRLVRFKVDNMEVASTEEQRVTSKGARCGILGAWRIHGWEHEDIEDFDDDYAKRMCLSIVSAVRTFATARGESTDEALVKSFLGKIRVFVADGAASVQRCGAMLQQHCPNLTVVVRDPTHAIRIATRDPLSSETKFGEQWQRLFGGKHSVIGDIQNSEVLRARLVACQRRVLRVDSAQGGGLTNVLKHFSFVQPRFESYVGPRRKYICLLQAIAMLLASVAGDQRNKKAMRERAEAALDAMTPGDTLACGLAADFAEVSLTFLRLFDCDDHDPATTSSQKAAFQEILHTLFTNGPFRDLPFPAQ